MSYFKNYKLLMISIVMLAQISIAGIVSYHGQMNVSGNKIMGSTSNEVAQAKGMSFFWSVWGGDQFYNAGAVNALVNDWKVELVRTAMSVEEDAGYVTNPNGQKGDVSAVVDAAIANDIYVIIDFHTHNAHQYQSQAIEFFTWAAEKYGAYDNVIFEVFNEPLAISWSTIKNYATPVIAAIRKHSDNLVVVGTPNWSQDVDDVIGNKINDANTAYTLHFYAGTHSGALRAKGDAALNANLAIMLTEWGTVNADGDGAVNAASTNNWLNWADQKGISWANWSVHTKNEGASAFKPGTSVTGSGWGSTSNMTASGQYVYNHLKAHALTASWRSGGTGSSSSTGGGTSSSSTAPPTGDGTQLLTNHDFLQGQTGWEKEDGAGDFSLSTSTDTYGSYLDVNINNGGAERWDVKVQQTGITLKKGYRYVMEWGATRASGSIQVGVGMMVDPWTDRMSDVISFSGDYEEHTVANGMAIVYDESCDASANESGLRFYVDMGGNNDDAKLAWFSLTEHSCEVITSVENSIQSKVDFDLNYINGSLSYNVNLGDNSAIAGQYSLSVYDVMGHQVLSHKNDISKTNDAVNMQLNSGVYFVNVSYLGNNITKRIVVQ